MYFPKEVLKPQRVRLEKLEKSEMCQKVVFDENGEIKDVTTILKELQKIFKRELNEYDSNYMCNDSIKK